MTPVSSGGELTIGLSIITGWAEEVLVEIMPAFVTGIVVFSAIVTLLAKALPDAPPFRPSVMKALFDVSAVWLWVRIAGAVFAVLIFFELGSEVIYGEATGKVILDDLAPVITVIFFFAVYLLPLLTDYGLMEFMGVLVGPAFRTLFRVPGRSAIDALASWMGSGTVGVLITIKQFGGGFYSRRESAIIATNFSIVSTAFCFTVAEFIGISHVFWPFYLTVVLAGLIAALIMCRIPPLSLIPDSYNEETGRRLVDEDREGSLVKAAWDNALERAAKAGGVKEALSDGTVNVLNIWFGLVPAVIAIGTISIMIAEATPVFTILSYPFIFILEALQIPEAVEAAPTMLIGFADMFLPAIIGKNIETEMTRFVIAVVSVSQLIYMSEVGVLLIQSRLPLNIPRLFVIFLMRTAIVLPIAAGVAHLMY